MTEQERPSEAAMRQALATELTAEAVPTVTVIQGETFIRVGKDYVAIRPKWVRHVARELTRIADDQEGLGTAS